jgi:branched-chain amino acid transport system permease protein
MQKNTPKRFGLSAQGIAIVVCAILYLVVYPLVFSQENYLLNIVITASILSVISLGVWLVFVIGRINIGQAAFVLIGAYTTAILTVRIGLSFWLCLPLSGIVAGLLGFLIGIPILRLKGVYFDMLTLCMTEAAVLAMLNFDKLTQGARGIMNIPIPGALKIGPVTVIPAFTPGNYLSFYFLTAAILILTLIALRRLYICRIGWNLRTLRQSDTLARSSGINIVKYRLIAYTICCFLGGIGGSLFVVYVQSIFPASFKIVDSIYYMLYCFLGGLNFLFGPVLGAFLLTFSFEGLRVIQKYQEGIYAGLMIVFMLWLPNGLLSLRFRRRYQNNSEVAEKKAGAIERLKRLLRQQMR